MTWPSTVGFLLMSLSGIYLARMLLMRSKGNLPPGPKGLPIIGNLLQLSLDAWIPFTQWKHKYGPLVYVTAASQGILIVNSHKAATELLDRRPHIYNSRPRFIVASEYLTGGMFLGTIPNNDVWKRMRRVVNEVLNKAMAPAFYPAQEEEAVRLASNIIQFSGTTEWKDEIQRSTSSLTVSMIYGLSAFESSKNPAIYRINDFVTRLTQAMLPGTYYVEYFPWMSYLPGFMSKWKSDVQLWHRQDTAFFKTMYDGVKERMRTDEHRENFTSNVINEQESYRLSETEVAWLSASLYAGSADTTASALSWFMLAMLVYPEVQKRCHEELDTIVGRDRMPRFSDLEDLPYIRATAREALRWRTVVPIGAPHLSTEDDWYEGYYIPKDTIVFVNTWAMNRDKNFYGQDADEFKPERHLGPDGKLAPSPPDTRQGNVSFGYGGRICPGRHIANSWLFINIACILWATEISPVEGEDGEYDPLDISDTATVNDGLVVRPLPFPCLITPRFPEATRVMDETRKGAEK